MVKVSIVVPVWKTEEYLSKCLDSLLAQTLKDIEILVINDGSPDNAAELMKKYEKIDKRIKCFYQKNKGVAEARNFGIKKATAKYIGFVDSDDWVETDMFETLYIKAESGKFDITVCGLNYIYPDEIKVRSADVKDDVIDKENMEEELLNLFPVIWNKLYKKELFDKVNFKSGTWFEDVEMLYRLYAHVTSIGMVKLPLYNYLQRSNSLSTTFDKRMYDYIIVWNGIIDYYKSNNIYEKHKKELEYCYVRYVFATLFKRTIGYSKKDFLKIGKEASKNVKEHFPNYRKNKYFHKNFRGLVMLLFNMPMFHILAMVKNWKLVRIFINKL